MIIKKVSEVDQLSTSSINNPFRTQIIMIHESTYEVNKVASICSPYMKPSGKGCYKLNANVLSACQDI